MELKSILYRNEDGILKIVLNRPEQRNALSPSMWEELEAALREARADHGVKVIILTSTDGKAFASGSDIGSLHDRGHLAMLEYRAGNVLRFMDELEKPILCAIDGWALGGGCELAMACDIRLATRRSKFGQPELGLGILPGAGGTQRLVSLVGAAKAKELIFTGRIIDAREACSIGLINQVVADDPGVLMEAVDAMAREIAGKAPVALRLAKISINAAAQANLQTGLTIERLAETVAFSTEDRREGTAAFLEKRSPRFQGR